MPTYVGFKFVNLTDVEVFTKDWFSPFSAQVVSLEGQSKQPKGLCPHTVPSPENQAFPDLTSKWALSCLWASSLFDLPISLMSTGTLENQVKQPTILWSKVTFVVHYLTIVSMVRPAVWRGRPDLLQPWRRVHQIHRPDPAGGVLPAQQRSPAL